MVGFLLVGLLSTQCSPAGSSGGDDIPEGKAIQAPASKWTFKPSAMPVGQEFNLVFLTLRNVTDHAIRIRGIEPISAEGVPTVARIVGIDLIPRRGVVGRHLPMGAYQSYPPIIKVNGVCRTASIRPPSGFVLSPEGPVALIATRFRAVGIGTAKMTGQRVTYEQDGTVFQQFLPIKVRVRVRENAKPRPSTPTERECRDERN